MDNKREFEVKEPEFHTVKYNYSKGSHASLRPIKYKKSDRDTQQCGCCEMQRYMRRHYGFGRRKAATTKKTRGRKAAHTAKMLSERKLTGKNEKP
jgi:hypothetical protein